MKILEQSPLRLASKEQIKLVHQAPNHHLAL